MHITSITAPVVALALLPVLPVAAEERKPLNLSVRAEWLVHPPRATASRQDPPSDNEKDKEARKALPSRPGCGRVCWAAVSVVLLSYVTASRVVKTADKGLPRSPAGDVSSAR